MNTSDLHTDLQRLADGELHQAERSQLLREITSDSKYWRDLALAFVERQILEETLSNSSSTSETLDRNEFETTSRRPRRLAPSDVAIRSTRLTRGENSRGRMMWLCALGASLLIGIAAGVWQARATAPHLSALADVRESESRTPPVIDPSQSLDELPGMPLAEALSRGSYPVPVDLRRELMKRGYLITELDRLSKVQLPTGQLVEMPVRQVAVTYLGTATYQ